MSVYVEGSVTSWNGASGLLQGVILANCTGGSEPGADWTVELNQNTKDSSLADVWGATHKEVILSNDGDSGNENIIVGIREWEYAAGSAYNWDLNAYLTVPTGWNGNAGDHNLGAYDGTWEHWTELPILQLIDGTITYWLHSDRFRILLTVKVSTYAYTMDLGAGDRLGTPGEYPYPIICAGSNYGNVNNTAGGYHVIKPADYTYFIIGPGNIYSTGKITAVPDMIPMQSDVSSDTIGPTEDGDKLLVPAFAHVGFESGASPGDIVLSPRGAMGIRGPSVQSEDIIRTSNRKYRAFQRGNAVGVTDFWAMEMPTTTTTT